MEKKFTATREDGLTPNGNPIARRWVVRTESGEFVEVDQYRNDLDARYRGQIEFQGQ